MDYGADLMRGYFGIGIINLKKDVNIGSLWRSAYIFGAVYIYVTGRRYQKQSSDTIHAYKSIPLFHYETQEQFLESRPLDAQLVAIETGENYLPLNTFIHPERAVYVLGAEDGGIPKNVLDKCQYKVYIPSVRDVCLNVAVAGTIIMYDRMIKQGNKNA